MKEDFTDPSKKIDKLIREKEQVEGKRLKSVESQRIYDNIKFADKVEHDPIVSKEFEIENLKIRRIVKAKEKYYNPKSQ